MYRRQRIDAPLSHDVSFFPFLSLEAKKKMSLSESKKNSKDLHVITYRVQNCVWSVRPTLSGEGREGVSVHSLLACFDLFRSSQLSACLTGSTEDVEADQISFFLSPG